MKKALQIICYFMAILMGLGAFGLASEGALDGTTFLTLMAIETQCILTLVYIHKK